MNMSSRWKACGKLPSSQQGPEWHPRRKRKPPLRPRPPTVRPGKAAQVADLRPTAPEIIAVADAVRRPALAATDRAALKPAARERTLPRRARSLIPVFSDTGGAGAAPCPARPAMA